MATLQTLKIELHFILKQILRHMHILTNSLLSSTTAQSRRDSNMELLRIVAMLLVMIVHADFRALQIPSVTDFYDDTYRTVMRLFIESLSIICVNTFVLLSGWFGIRFRFERMFEFLFQVCFFSILGIGIATLTAPNEVVSLRGVASFLLLGDKDYWFVKCYLLMYLFAPVMNSFVEHCSERQFRIFLLCFYAFQTVYGFVGGAEWFKLGYSGLSFMGLYLLARYIRLYPNRFTSLNKRWDMVVYFSFVVVMTLLSVAVLAAGQNPKIIGRIYAYTSPLVIVPSVYFLLFFSKIKLSYNKVINWVAASCFAIYLVHSNIWLARHYDGVIQHLFATHRGFGFFAHAILFILLVFIVSILIDKIRLLLWRLIAPLFQHKKEPIQ